jgi:hypothetical protein
MSLVSNSESKIIKNIPKISFVWRCDCGKKNVSNKCECGRRLCKCEKILKKNEKCGCPVKNYKWICLCGERNKDDVCSCGRWFCSDCSYNMSVDIEDCKCKESDSSDEETESDEESDKESDSSNEESDEESENDWDCECGIESNEEQVCECGKWICYDCETINGKTRKDCKVCSKSDECSKSDDNANGDWIWTCDCGEEVDWNEQVCDCGKWICYDCEEVNAKSRKDCKHC